MVPLHPFVVHFPIALIAAAGVFYLLSLFLPGKKLGHTGFYLHAAGLLACIAAIFTGDFEEHRILQSEELHELIEQHEMMGMISAWAFGLLGVWAYLRQKSNIKVEKIVFVLVFWGTIGVLGYSAHLGGRMVYEEGAGVSKIQTASPGHSTEHEHDDD